MHAALSHPATQDVKAFCRLDIVSNIEMQQWSIMITRVIRGYSSRIGTTPAADRAQRFVLRNQGGGG
jgi:hypothetical protein